MTNEGLSLVDVAEIILLEKKEALNIYELFNLVCKRKEVKENMKKELISQFYADLTVAAKFVYVGDNTWDLKGNQKIELWEKDGSFYKEYTEVVIPDEYLDKEAKKPTKAKAKKAKVPKAVKEVVEQVEVKEVDVEAKPEKEDVVVPVVEAVTEPVVEAVVADAKPAVEGETPEVVEEFEEELFPDFDEEKYNEYMDTYEDQYKD